jgi:hypothetical protein
MTSSLTPANIRQYSSISDKMPQLPLYTCPYCARTFTHPPAFTQHRIACEKKIDEKKANKVSPHQLRSTSLVLQKGVELCPENLQTIFGFIYAYTARLALQGGGADIGAASQRMGDVVPPATAGEAGHSAHRTTFTVSGCCVCQQSHGDSSHYNCPHCARTFTHAPAFTQHRISCGKKAAAAVAAGEVRWLNH